MSTINILDRVKKVLAKHHREGEKSKLSLNEVAMLKDFIWKVERQLELSYR
jgi:hypothetical protein